MPMKRTKYLIIHAIQTGIYSVLLILMSCIKDKNSDDKLFMAFYGFLTVAVMVCILIAIIAMCIRGDDDEK
jgi:uncharacterized membrane protein YhaH (DUF805 family)